MTNDLDARVESLETIAQNQEARLNLLTVIAERQQTLIESIESHLKQMDERMDEYRRETAQTQRLWVRLIERLGLLDDEDDEDNPQGG